MTADPASIRLLALDVDGVLTDGTVSLDDAGRELRAFHTRDGVALRVWQRLGFVAAIVSGRSGRALEHRMRQLAIPEVVQGCADKGRAVRELCARTGIPLRETAFLADDWPDLPALRAVGYPMAVADAAPEVRAAAAFITTAPGGHGAVRDAVEHLLDARDMRARAVALYDADAPAPGAG